MGNSVAVAPGHPAKQNRGKRLPATQKVERDRQIVIDRNRGLSWPQVAQRHGVQERQARGIYREWRESNIEAMTAYDPVEWLFDTLDRYEAIIGQLALIAEDGDNAAARVGALRTLMMAMDKQAELLRGAGLLPSLRCIREELDFRLIGRKLAEALDRHGVADEVQLDIVNTLTAPEFAMYPPVQAIEGSSPPIPDV